MPLVVAMHSILVRLKLGDFFKPLAKRPAKVMTKLLTQSTKFINMEEVEAIKQPSEQEKYQSNERSE